MDGQADMGSCGVEASGWDAGANFFVEKTALGVSANGEEIRLRRSLPEGALVFLRLLHTGGDNFPIAYRVTQVDERGPDGRSCVRISPLRRRETRNEEFARWEKSIQVA
jgi:hypothetical protein